MTFNIKLLILRTLQVIITISTIFYIISIFLLFTHGGFDLEILGFHISAHTPSKIFPVALILIVITSCLYMKIKNGILTLCSIIMTLLIIEILLHIIDIPIANDPKLLQWRVPSKSLGWKNKPLVTGHGFGAHNEINSHGLRDIERTWKKPKGVYRILSLGDSFTYGYGLAIEDTYVKQLEKLLNQSGHDVDVINAGVIGYGLYQSLTYYKLTGIKYDPDLIIYYFWFDDIGGVNSSKSAEGVYISLLESNFVNEELRNKAERLESKIYILNFYKNVSKVMDYKLRPFISASWLHDIENRKEHILTESSKMILTGNVDLMLFKNQLLELKQVSQEQKSQLLVVLIPEAVQLHDSSLQIINRKLNEICLDNKISFIDITPIYEKFKNVSSLYLFPHDAHTSKKGDTLIAKTVCEYVLSIINDNAE